MVQRSESSKTPRWKCVSSTLFRPPSSTTKYSFVPAGVGDILPFPARRFSTCHPPFAHRLACSGFPRARAGVWTASGLFISLPVDSGPMEHRVLWCHSHCRRQPAVTRRTQKWSRRKTRDGKFLSDPGLIWLSDPQVPSPASGGRQNETERNGAMIG